MTGAGPASPTNGVYTQILDELIARHTTFWAAVDWLTQFGNDPKRGDYPPEWKGFLIPDHLWGEYDAPGWTANGIDPWGLQADPIGSDGNLFFRGFLKNGSNHSPSPDSRTRHSIGPTRASPASSPISGSSGPRDRIARTRRYGRFASPPPVLAFS
jgi:hypothetical protein